MNLQDIEALCGRLASARSVLETRTGELQSRMDTLVRRRLPGLKAAVARAAEAQAALQQAIEAHPEQFERPKTKIFHGLRVGYRKGQDTVTWEDDDTLVARIEKVFADDADRFLLIHKKPSKDALAELDAPTLKRLGVTREPGQDQVTVHAIDKDVSKLVNALVKGAVGEAMEKGEAA